MRPLRPVLPAIVALAVVLLTPSRVPGALAVNYAPGWNLVSGPEGSHLVGAVGGIYTLQPGDADYEAFPADSPLRGGYGYWAYFPQGGWLEPTRGTPSYSVTLLPGQWTLVGNPSAEVVVTVSHGVAALVYVPSDGYVSVGVIPPGVGAWVLGSGKLTLGPAEAPPTPPLPAAPLLPVVPTMPSHHAR
ncbi:MAG TPA: hypothetical protein VFD32_03265 [Dehalococcoidia bacterium]|nr:hypothetical protein [Dehalococcoidia bacterium]